MLQQGAKPLVRAFSCPPPLRSMKLDNFQNALTLSFLGLQRNQKKGKLSEFNSKSDGHINLSPAVTVWSQEGFFLNPILTKNPELLSPWSIGRTHFQSKIWFNMVFIGPSGTENSMGMSKLRS